MFPLSLEALEALVSYRPISVNEMVSKNDESYRAAYIQNVWGAINCTADFFLFHQM